MKKGIKGIIIITIILLILLIVLIGFIVYQIVWEDALGIMKGENPIESISLNPIFIEGNKKEDVETSENLLLILNSMDINNEVPEQEKQQFKYYYEQLDENAKIIYEGLENNISNMQTGNYKIDFDKQFNELLHEEDGEKKLNIAFQSAWNAFTYDYVEVFFVDVTKLTLTTQTTAIGGLTTHRVYLSNDENINYLSKTFETPEKVIEERANISKLREQVVNALKGYSQYEQIKYLHDWMINNIDYDVTCSKEEIYSIYGALRKGTAVCEGYARAFKYMLDGLGIPCVMVSGTATNSTGDTESHAWNYVKLNGKWYAIDVTWDDPIITGGGFLSKESRYKYFLKGSNNFFVGHKEDGKISENSVQFLFPIIEKTDYENN